MELKLEPEPELAQVEASSEATSNKCGEEEKRDGATAVNLLSTTTTTANQK